MTMLRLSRADAVIAQGTLCAVRRIDPHVVELRPLGGEDAPMSLSHLELLGQLHSGNFEVEYGYFGSRQAARRAMAGRGLLSLLSSAEQHLVFWKIDWCEAFLAAEASGEASRSDRSCSAFIPELERRVMEKTRQAANGNVLPDVVFRPAPCRTSLMAWVRIWEKTRDPMALVKRSRFNGVNARKIGRDREAVLQRKLADYLHPNRILIPELHRTINAEIREWNADAGSAGLLPVPEISESTVRRRLVKIDRFELCAARHGVAEAKNRLGSYGAGLQVDIPLQRIEMDEWEIDLMAILAAGGFDISDARLRDLALGRYWACVAFDAATRSILALKLSKAPCVEDALATIWMAMRDKTAIARRLGCETGCPISSGFPLFRCIIAAMKEGDQPGRSAAWCQIDRSRRIKLACDIADHSAALMPVQAGGSDLRTHLDKMIDPDDNRFPQVDLILQIFGKLLPILESALSDTRGS